MKISKVKNVIVYYIALIFAPLSSHANEGAGITGLEKLFWPIVIINYPFYKFNELVNGSDHKAMQETGEAAAKILQSTATSFYTNGLYVHGVSIEYALYGLLVDRQIQFIESDINYSDWVAKYGKLKKEIEGAGYIRFSLSDDGDENCFLWKDGNSNWTKAPPVRPGVCLKATEETRLQSELELSVDVSNWKKRELSWTLSSREDSATLLKVPFWEYQTEGKPLRFSALFRNRYDTSPFARVAEKIFPLHNPVYPENRSRLMKWNDFEKGVRRYIDTIDIVATVRKPRLIWDAPDQNKNQRWEDGYRKAYKEMQPVLLNESLLIDPIMDRVGFQFDWDFGKRKIHKRNIVMAFYTQRYCDNGKCLEMKVLVHGVGFDGNRHWSLSLTPEMIPEDASKCLNADKFCYFYPIDLKINDEELVIYGEFSNTADIRSDRYEWAVPLTKLPPLGASDSARFN